PRRAGATRIDLKYECAPGVVKTPAALLLLPATDVPLIDRADELVVELQQIMLQLDGLNRLNLGINLAHIAPLAEAREDVGPGTGHPTGALRLPRVHRVIVERSCRGPHRAARLPAPLSAGLFPGGRRSSPHTSAPAI